jgi:hypothetical protein
MDDRTNFLEKKIELNIPLTDSERRELAETPQLVGERDANGNFIAPMVVPRRPASMEDWVRQPLHSDGHEATPDEVANYLNGGRVQSPSPPDAPPVSEDQPDDWANDAEPTPAVASVAEPPPVSASVPPAPEAPQPAPGDDDLIEVHDPSYPRNPPKLIRRSLLEKQQRKQRMNAAKAMRRGPDAGGRKMSF